VQLRLHESATEIRDILESVSHERARRQVAALAFLAVHKNLSVSRQFFEVIAQVIQRNVRGARQAARLGNFGVIANPCA